MTVKNIDVKLFDSTFQTPSVQQTAQDYKNYHLDCHMHHSTQLGACSDATSQLL